MAPWYPDRVSLCRFEGEDLAKPERRHLQSEQQRSWLQQQMRERRRAEEERRAAEDAYQAAMVARDLRACQLDRIEQHCRRRLNQTTEEYNRALVSIATATPHFKSLSQSAKHFAHFGVWARSPRSRRRGVAWRRVATPRTRRPSSTTT